MNYLDKKPRNKKHYYNLYHDSFNFIKVEIISLTQQADITNNITETNNQTITYVDNNYLNNDKIATIILHPTPPPPPQKTIYGFLKVYLIMQYLV